MADCNICRPLPADMFNYARCDTHFLLYVFDNMRNELIDSSNPSTTEGDLIEQVLERSKKETLQIYEIPSYDAELGMGSGGWYNTVFRTPNLFTKEQFAVFRAAHQWRDRIAREEDEGVTTILSKADLFNIAHHLPIDTAALFSCCRANSDAFKRRAEDLLEIIKNVKASSQDAPEMAAFLESHPETVRRDAATAEWKERQEASPKPVTSAPADAPKETFSDSVRSTLSRFWGGNTGQPSRKYSTQTGSSHVEDEIRLSIPLPKLNANVFETPETNGYNNITPVAVNPGALVEHEYIKPRKSADSDVFVIRDLASSKKRKATDVEGGERPPEKIDNVTEANQKAFDDNQSIERARLKAERKAIKAQKKLENGQRPMDGLQQDELDIQPFDYTTAASVLHSKNEPPNVQRPGAANPYSRSLNAPHGMRRTRTETSGKSFTFKR